MMRLHTSRGGAILFSTHVMEIAEELCDRIAIINNGGMVAVGTMEELRQKADQLGGSLEELFLKLTGADESVNQIIENLGKAME
jgi:ABC-2 type transport system ATP-binding protein